MNGSTAKATELDPDYGSQGIAKPDPRLYTIGNTIQTRDGQVGVGMWDVKDNDSQYVIFRLDQQGKLDASFAENGVTTGLIEGNRFSIGTDVVQLHDGRFIMLGQWVTHNMASPYYLTRFDAKGGLDTTFGNDGHLVIYPPSPAGTGAGEKKAAQSQPEPVHPQKAHDRLKVERNYGYILAPSSTGAYLTFSSEYEGGIIKFNDDGTYDRAFGNEGVIHFSRKVTEHNRPASLRVDNEGLTIGLISRQQGLEGPYTVGIVRLTHEGVFDDQFGDNGYAFLDSGFAIKDHCVLPDQRIIIAAIEMVSEKSEYFLFALNEDGTPDKDFKQDPHSFNAIFDARLEYDSNNQTILAIVKNHTLDARLLLGRFRPDGEHIDNRWDPIDLFVNSLGGVRVQPDGKTIIDGQMVSTGVKLSGFSLRLLPG
ncbi:hypothetical protein [Pseudomonas asiatica]|uniref:hypothetical protein n=1 Tax=Pseudomonas asiatica TaxID=2219225 RepID=UPI0037C9F340